MTIMEPLPHPMTTMELLLQLQPMTDMVLHLVDPAMMIMTVMTIMSIINNHSMTEEALPLHPTMEELVLLLLQIMELVLLLPLIMEQAQLPLPITDLVQALVELALALIAVEALSAVIPGLPTLSAATLELPHKQVPSSQLAEASNLSKITLTAMAHLLLIPSPTQHLPQTVMVHPQHLLSTQLLTAMVLHLPQ